MAVRKRFTAAERDLITSGALLQVQNVTQWHDWAPMHAPALIVRDAYGWEHVAGTVERSRGTLRAGEPYRVTPGHVRARPAEVIDNTHGRGFEHACRGSWRYLGANAAGHEVYACDSGRHLAVSVHPSAGHQCLTALGCASAEVTVKA